MAIDPYLDPASGTLRNKLGITDPTKLSNFERDASALRQASMIANPVGGKLDFDHFKAVHERLFQDVYDWAGQTRTVEISKGNSAFANVCLISDTAPPSSLHEAIRQGGADIVSG